MKRFIPGLLAALGILVTFSVTGAEEKTKVAVLDLKAKSGIEAAKVSQLTDLVCTEIDAIGTYEVIGRDDMQAMLEHIADKQLLECDDTKCLAKVGGALGVEQLVSGNIGMLGDTYLINMKLIDIDNAVVLKRHSEKYTGGEAGLIDLMHTIVGVLFGAAPAEPEPKSAPAPPVAAEAPAVPPAPAEPAKASAAAAEGMRWGLQFHFGHTWIPRSEEREQYQPREGSYTMIRPGLSFFFRPIPYLQFGLGVNMPNLDYSDSEPISYAVVNTSLKDRHDGMMFVEASTGGISIPIEALARIPAGSRVAFYAGAGAELMFLTVTGRLNMPQFGAPVIENAYTCDESELTPLVMLKGGAEIRLVKGLCFQIQAGYDIFGFKDDYHDWVYEWVQVDDHMDHLKELPLSGLNIASMLTYYF